MAQVVWKDRRNPPTEKNCSGDFFVVLDASLADLVIPELQLENYGVDYLGILNIAPGILEAPLHYSQDYFVAKPHLS